MGMEDKPEVEEPVIEMLMNEKTVLTSSLAL